MKPKPGIKDFLWGRKNDNVTEEEIVSMVTEGHEQGVIEESELEMITNIFELDDKEAKDIMTHRKNVVCISADMSLDDAAMFILDDSHSRFPVYDDNYDNIIGILYLKDAFVFREKEGRGKEAIKDIDGLLRDAVFIPETRKIQDVFEEMQKKKIHMEVVIDEYGQTAGIVTMEDILEEIVGNIFDEYDEVEHNIVKLSDNVYKILGITPLYELTEELGIEFDDDDYETINGYLIAKIDRIPEDGEKINVDVGKYHYMITEISDKMISTIKLKIDEDNTESNS